MTSRDRDAFIALLQSLAELFGRELKPALVDLYWGALNDLALSTVQVMAKSHAKTGRYFPKPLELRPVEARALPVAITSEAFRDGERRAALRLELLRIESPEEWLRQVRPKVTELGLAKGMHLGEIESKLARYLREGAR